MSNPENKLEGHARAISDAYAPAVDAKAPYAKHMAKKAATDCLLVELALEPSEECVLAVATALCNVEWRGNKFPAMTGADRDYWMQSARAALKAARAKRAEEISNV